jgi:2-keto-4-pentenoate hydratase
VTSHQQAAEFLVKARRSGVPGARIPEAFRPEDTVSALAVQREVTALLGDAIGGWKCSVPMGDRILVAPIYASTIYRSSPISRVAKDGMVDIEPEIAYVLKQDLGPRNRPYSTEDVRAAIGESRLSLELLSSRYADPDPTSWAEKLADHVMNEGLLVGPVISAADDRPTELAISIDGPQGSILARTGQHPSGDPFPPLVWLANFFAMQGESLRAGQIITTGSYLGIVKAPIGVSLKITWGTLGSVAVEFTPRG